MNNVVLVTGGTAGIGLELARAFMRKGSAVAVCGRSSALLDDFAKAHPAALTVQADVTDAGARVAMLDAVQQRYGRLDLLVNNAGTFNERDFAADPDATADLEQEVAINLTAPIQLTGEVLNRFPAVREIVFVTSAFALVPSKRAPT